MFNELQDASVFRMKNVFESGLYVVERVIQGRNITKKVLMTPYFI